MAQPGIGPGCLRAGLGNQGSQKRNSARRDKAAWIHVGSIYGYLIRTESDSDCVLGSTSCGSGWLNIDDNSI